MFTYSSTRFSIETARWIYHQKKKPLWIHHPCAVAGKGLDLIQKADKIIAFNRGDINLAKRICGSDYKVISIPPSSHESRLGKKGNFRKNSGITCKYILWAGAWSPAKGVTNLVSRFHKLRYRHPKMELKLVMFGGYGDLEYPPTCEDILRYDRNAKDLPSAISDCLFVAFNSPAPPIGYDANPLILLEALMHGKTFIAQWGTPFLHDIRNLGICVNNDTEWVEAAEKLIFDKRHRDRLEKKCRRAYLKTYNFYQTMLGVEGVLKDIMIKKDR
jgi:glycosyltransferase involved in cell wall biosynthesis